MVTCNVGRKCKLVYNLFFKVARIIYIILLPANLDCEWTAVLRLICVGLYGRMWVVCVISLIISKVLSSEHGSIKFPLLLECPTVLRCSNVVYPVSPLLSYFTAFENASLWGLWTVSEDHFYMCFKVAVN